MLSCTYPRVELLGHRLCVCLAFVGTARFTKGYIPTYRPPKVHESSSCCMFSPTVDLVRHFKIFIYLFIYLLRERDREERNTDLLFHPSMQSLVDSCRCPDRGSNWQPPHIRTTLQPTTQPGPVRHLHFSLSGRCLCQFILNTFLIPYQL